MKKITLLVAAIVFTNLTAMGQIDGNLLLGLVSATTAEINNITNPVAGSLVYNLDEGKMYVNTGSGFARIPSIDTNSIDFWGATGTTGSNANVNFLGTLDAEDMVVRTNNIEALRILQNNQNIGIGIPLPSEKLDVNGNIRIRNIATTTADLDVLVTTINGVVQKRAFADFEGPQGNPGNDGVSITNATLNTNKELIITLSNANTINAGQVIDPKLNFGGRWTNTDITTDINIDNTIAPIFGDEDYKDDGDNLYEVNGNTLIIKEAGRYDIRVNLSLLGTGTNNSRQRTNTSARIAVNNTPIGAFAGSGYIRHSNNNNNTSSIHMNEILNLNANDVLTVITFRKANSGSVVFSGVAESSFVINKLR